MVRIAGDASKYITVLDQAKSKTLDTGSSISSSIDTTSTRVNESLEKIAGTLKDYIEQTNKATEDLRKLREEKRKVSQEADTLSEKISKAGQNILSIGQAAQRASDSFSQMTAGLNFNETLSFFNRQEKAERLVEAALRTQIPVVSGLADEYKRFASEIQSVTTYGDEQVLELIRQAAAFGLNEQQVKRAIKNAVGLAAATDRSTREVIKATVKLEAGSTEMLQEYIPTLIGMKDKTEKVAYAQETLGKMFGIAKESAKTTSGQLQQLSNAWGDFKETIGSTIATGLMPFINIARGITDFFQMLPTPIKAVVGLFLTLTTVTAFLAVGIGTLTVAFGALGTALGSIITLSTATSIALIALKGALVASVAYAAYQAGKAISGVDEEVRKFNEAIKKSQELNDKWANKFTKNTTDILKKIDELDNKETKGDYLSKQLKIAQKELLGYQNAVKAADKEVADLNDRWNRWTGNKELEVANENLEDNKRKLELAKSRVDQLSEALKNIKTPKLDPTLNADINKLVDQLNEQTMTIGKTNNEIELYKLKLRGMGEETERAINKTIQLNNALNQVRKIGNDTQTQIKELQKAYDDMNNGLTPEQNKTIHLLEEQKKLFDELTKSANEANVPFEKRQKINEELNRTGKIIQELIDLQQRMEKRTELNRIFNIAEETRKQFGAVFDFRKKEELDKAFATGRMSAQVYADALEDIRKKYDDAFYAANKFKNSIDKVNAVKFGSREALDHIDEYKEKLQESAAEFLRIQRQRQHFGLPEPIPKPQKPTYDELRMLQMKEDAEKKQKEIEFENRQFNLQNYRNQITPQQSINDDAKDRKETNTILQRIEDILRGINGKPVTNLGIVDIKK